MRVVRFPTGIGASMRGRVRGTVRIAPGYEHRQAASNEEPAVSRHRRTRALAPLALASLLTLSVAGGVLGKCNHDPAAECPAGVVAIIDGNGSLTAGSTETVAIWLHEDEVPYLADAVNVVFTRVGDGTTINVIAVESGREQMNLTRQTAPSLSSSVADRTLELEGLEGMEEVRD